jgi:hypothetical protein
MIGLHCNHVSYCSFRAPVITNENFWPEVPSDLDIGPTGTRLGETLKNQIFCYLQSVEYKPVFLDFLPANDNNCHVCFWVCPSLWTGDYDLLLHKKQSLIISRPSEPLVILARMLTLTLLPQHCFDRARWCDWGHFQSKAAQEIQIKKKMSAANSFVERNVCSSAILPQ